MSMEQIKNNDPIQLKQMIIFLKAELTKYERKVNDFENNYHYSIVEDLEQENARLREEKNELAKKVRETRRVKFTPTFEKMREARTDLLPINKQLHDLAKIIKENVDTNETRYLHHERQIAALHKEYCDYKSTIEQSEKRLVDLVQKSANSVHTQIESLTITNEERFQSEEAARRYQKELDEKNELIANLQQEIVDLQKQLEIETISSEKEAVIAAELLQLVEKEVEEVLAMSVEYEENLNAKLAIIHQKDMDEKNDLIANLQQEIVDLQKQLELASIRSEKEGVVAAKLLQLVEEEVDEVLAKSAEYEENLNAKLEIIRELEKKLDQLTVKINEIDVDDESLS